MRPLTRLWILCVTDTATEKKTAVNDGEEVAPWLVTWLVTWCGATTVGLRAPRNCVALLCSCRRDRSACWAASSARAAPGTGESNSTGDVSGSCHNEEVSECVSKLDLLSRNKSLAFATTEAELSRICNHLTDAMECVNGFTRRCFNERQREIYRRLTSGAAQLIEDFCREGSRFRLTYLKHSKCYKELQDDYNHCAAVYMAQRAELQGQVVSPQEKIRLSCCQMDGYKHCAKGAVLRHCDVEAAELAEDIIVKAGGYLLSTHCAGYRINEPTCSSCSGRTAFSLPTVLALAAWMHHLSTRE